MGKVKNEETKSGHEEINDRLHEAIDGLRKDVTRVEIWATALGSFSQPVPDYSPSKKFELSNGQKSPKENADALQKSARGTPKDDR